MSSGTAAVDGTVEEETWVDMAWGPYQGTISFFVDMASHITDMGAMSLHRGAISLCKGTRSFCVENKIQYGHSLATLNHGAPDQV